MIQQLDSKIALAKTAEEIKAAGEKCVTLACDHSNEESIKAVFEQIKTAEEKLDILVNNAWPGYENMTEKNINGQEVWTWVLRPPQYRERCHHRLLLRSACACCSDPRVARRGAQITYVSLMEFARLSME